MVVLYVCIVFQDYNQHPWQATSDQVWLIGFVARMWTDNPKDILGTWQTGSMIRWETNCHDEFFLSNIYSQRKVSHTSLNRQFFLCDYCWPCTLLISWSIFLHRLCFLHDFVCVCVSWFDRLCGLWLEAQGMFWQTLRYKDGSFGVAVDSDSNIFSHYSKCEMHFVDNKIRNSNFLMKKTFIFQWSKISIGWSFLVFVLWHSENMRCHAGEIKLHYAPNKRPEMAPDYPRFEMKPSQKSKYSSSNQQVCFIFYFWC